MPLQFGCPSRTKSYVVFSQNAMGYYNSSKVDFDFFTMTGRSFDYMVYGAGCTEVEVDCETGDISVRSADLVMDVGKSINPAIDVGQVCSVPDQPIPTQPILTFLLAPNMALKPVFMLFKWRC